MPLHTNFNLKFLVISIGAAPSTVMLHGATGLKLKSAKKADLKPFAAKASSTYDAPSSFMKGTGRRKKTGKQDRGGPKRLSRADDDDDWRRLSEPSDTREQGRGGRTQPSHVLNAPPGLENNPGELLTDYVQEFEKNFVSGAAEDHRSPSHELSAQKNFDKIPTNFLNRDDYHYSRAGPSTSASDEDLRDIASLGSKSDFGLFPAEDDAQNNGSELLRAQTHDDDDVQNPGPMNQRHMMPSQADQIWAWHWQQLHQQSLQQWQQQRLYYGHGYQQAGLVDPFVQAPYLYNWGQKKNQKKKKHQDPDLIRIENYLKDTDNTIKRFEIFMKANNLDLIQLKEIIASNNKSELLKLQYELEPLEKQLHVTNLENLLKKVNAKLEPELKRLCDEVIAKADAKRRIIKNYYLDDIKKALEKLK